MKWMLSLEKLQIRINERENSKGTVAEKYA